MSVQETPTELWGGETTKAVANFPVSGERVPLPVVRWLGRIKGNAARVNAELGLLDAGAGGQDRRRGRRDRRRQARRAVPDRRLPDRLGHLVEHERQRGHRDALGRAPERPREHGAELQRRVPVAPSTSRPWTRPRTRCCRRWSSSRPRFAAKAEAFKDLVKSGRTHLMDAVPVTLGQEFAGYAAQIRLGRRRVENALPQVAQIPLGGTATGTGLNTHRDFAAKVREKLSADTGLTISAPEDPFEAQGNRDALVELCGALKVDRGLADQDRRRPRADGLRPARRHRRDLPARAAEGLLDHAGQGQPGDPGGRAAGRRAGDRQRHGDHGRRPPGPVRAQRPDPADGPQPAAVDPRCSRARRRSSPRSAWTASSRTCRPRASAEGTLAVATALNPFIGYDKAAEIVKDASEIRGHAARGRAQARRRRGDAGQGAGPAQDRRGFVC